MIKKIVGIFFFFIFSFGYHFTKEQIKNLKECTLISEIFNNNPELVCSIMLNETAAGKDKKDGVGDRFLRPFDRSYGIMQVRLKTAREMIEKFNLLPFKKMPQEQILVHLMEDNRFNIAIANVYISYLKKRFHNNEKKIVIAYNSGYYNPRNTKYYIRFLENKKVYKEFKEKYEK